MTAARTATLTLLAMAAFAGNSLLCRLALGHTAIDAATFTSLRLVSGALVLWLITRRARHAAPFKPGQGNWLSAAALFVYAAAFSFAYVSLPAGSGALLLFGAVQATMIGYGIATGERLRPAQWAGLALALAGLVGLLLPGAASPPPAGAVMMLMAGAAWGVYSLRGRGAGDATRVTAGNFARAACLAIVCSAVLPVFIAPAIDIPGALYALASGILTSGLGYAIWYTALPALKATTAATVQLSVPVLAAIGGIVLLGEAPTLRLALASVAILGGIALVVLQKRPSPS